MKQHDVHVFVFDGLADWEMAYAVAGINSPQFQRAPGRYRIRTVALRDRSVVSMAVSASFPITCSISSLRTTARC